MSVTHEHAVEVDTKLASLWEAQQKADMAIQSAVASLHSALGHKRSWNVRKGESPYAESTGETVTAARSIVEAREPSPSFGPYIAYEGGVLATHIGESLERGVADLDKARDAIKAARTEAQPLEAEYEAERWPRFFLVTNTGGHIHSSMHCATTFPTTQWAWLPDLSGLTEDAAVADQGPRLCSVCFPSAPVEWTLGLPKKLNPAQCPGSSQQAVDVIYRYRTPRGRCAVCGTSVAVSNTGKARPHNTPK